MTSVLRFSSRPDPAQQRFPMANQLRPSGPLLALGSSFYTWDWSFSKAGACCFRHCATFYDLSFPESSGLPTCIEEFRGSVEVWQHGFHHCHRRGHRNPTSRQLVPPFALAGNPKRSVISEIPHIFSFTSLDKRTGDLGLIDRHVGTVAVHDCQHADFLAPRLIPACPSLGSDTRPREHVQSAQANLNAASIAMDFPGSVLLILQCLFFPQPLCTA